MYRMHVENLTPEQMAAEWVGQENIKGPGLTAGGRAAINLLGDTFDERKAVFDRLYPDGDYREVPETDIVLFKKGGDEQFRKVDPGFREAFAQDFAKEFGRDIADLAGDAPEIIGELLFQLSGSTLKKIPGAGPVLRRVLPAGSGRAAVNAATRKTRNTLFRLFLGGTFGEGGQQALQSAAGTQLESLPEQAKRSGTTGTYSLIGGTFGAAVGGAANIVKRRGAGLIPGGKVGAEEVQRAATRTGAGTLPITVISDAPLLQRIGNQARSVLPFLNRYIQKVDANSIKVARALVNKEARDKFLTRSLEAHRNAAKHIVDFAEKAVRHRKLHPRTQGIGIKDKISQWWRASGIDVDDAYRVARSIEEPAFVLDDAVEHARLLDEGIFTRTPDCSTRGSSRR
jgi:hypothetical protein